MRVTPQSVPATLEGSHRTIRSARFISHSDHKFYVAMAIGILITVFWGFAPSYYFRSTVLPAPRSLPALIHLHAIAFSAWIFVLLAQTTLVAADRIALHRRLGLAAGALAPVIVVLGFFVAIQGARDGWNPGGGFPDSLAFMAVGLADLLLFFGFVGAGLYYRRQPEVHKRLMLLGTIGGLTWPAITRMAYIAPRPAPMFAVLGLLVLTPAARDLWRTRRIHPANLWGTLVIIASFPIRGAIAMTSLWHGFAYWLINRG